MGLRLLGGQEQLEFWSCLLHHSQRRHWEKEVGGGMVSQQLKSWIELIQVTRGLNADVEYQCYINAGI